MPNSCVHVPMRPYTAACWVVVRLWATWRIVAASMPQTGATTSGEKSRYRRVHLLDPGHVTFGVAQLHELLGDQGVDDPEEEVRVGAGPDGQALVGLLLLFERWFLDVDCIPDVSTVERYTAVLDAAEQDPALPGTGPAVRHGRLPAARGAPCRTTARRRSSPIPTLGVRRPPPAPGRRRRRAAVLVTVLRDDGPGLDRGGRFRRGVRRLRRRGHRLRTTARRRGGPLLWVGDAAAYHQHHPTAGCPAAPPPSIVRNANVFRDAGAGSRWRVGWPSSRRVTSPAGRHRQVGGASARRSGDARCDRPVRTRRFLRAHWVGRPGACRPSPTARDGRRVHPADPSDPVVTFGIPATGQGHGE